MRSSYSKILRWILGLGLIVFGSNKFIGFMDTPALPPDATQFLQSLEATGYVLPIIGVLEIGIGLLVLLNKWVPFALLLLVPITVNIVLFHLFLDMPGILTALVIALLNVLLIHKYWKAYRPLFQDPV